MIEVDRSCDWTFTTVVLALYDQFIHDSVMQEARTKFKKATFVEGGGTVEGFQDLIKSYIHNMMLKPDDYMVQKLFMKQIPPAMRNTILEDHLRVELNMLDELVLSGKAWENTERSKKEYGARDTPPAHKSRDKSMGSKDHSRPFPGMKLFLCPKNNPQNCSNNHEVECPRA